MKQIDIIEIIPECVLLSFLLIISFSLIKKRKLFKSLKTKYLLQVYFAILIIESIDRLYVIVNDSYFFSTSFTNFSYADTCFYLFLSENLIKKRKYFNYIVLFFVFTINFLYVESHRRYFLLIDYIFNLLVLIYFFYLLKSFTGEKSKRFKIENRFFTKFIYMMLFYMSLSYIIPISINILSVLAPNLKKNDVYVYITVLPFWLISFIVLIKEKINYRFNDVPIRTLPTFKKRTLKGKEGKTLKDFEFLIELIIRERIYKDTKLTLDCLGSKIGMNSKYISKLINLHKGVNFNDFINNLRVEEFKKNIKKEEYKGYSILGVALESGFSSKSTFYKAFKKNEDMSPKEYLKSI